MEREVLSTEFLAALCSVAQLADQLVNLVLDKKPYASVMREIIEELDQVHGWAPVAVGGSDLEEVIQFFREVDIGRVELRNGNIWLFEKAEEEEECQAKT